MRDANYFLFGNRKSIKLTTAAQALGIRVSHDSYHRALYDARLAGQVYRQLTLRQGGV